MASASYSPAGTSKRNPLNPALSAEPSNTGHGQASKIGPSSSWMSSLQRISSSKWMSSMVIFWFMLFIFLEKLLVLAAVSFVTTLILIYLYFVVFLFPGLNRMKIPRRIDMWSCTRGWIASFPECLVKNIKVVYSWTWRLWPCWKFGKLHSSYLRRLRIASFLRWLTTKNCEVWNTDYPGLGPGAVHRCQMWHTALCIRVSCNISVWRSPFSCYVTWWSLSMCHMISANTAWFKYFELIDNIINCKCIYSFFFRGSF